MAGAVERSEAGAAFNLAYRILGSERNAAEAARQALREASQAPPDAERSSDLALFAATRGACHRLISRRPPPLPAEAVPASGESSEEAIAAASMRLPIRQREALALRELGRLSHAEIANVMETGHSAVAQLISRARINLSDELRGTVLASIAAPSRDCERSLPLIAMREDGQLAPGSADAAWLDTHLGSCERCRLGVGAMQEAADAYGGWAPLAAPASLLGSAAAKAAAPDAAAAATPAADRRRPRRRTALVAGLALLLFLTGLSAALLRSDPAPPPLDPAAAAPEASAATPAAKAQAKERNGTRRDGRKGRREGAARASTVAEEPRPLAVVPVTTEPSPDSAPPRPQRRPSGGGAVEATQKASAPKPSAKRKPAPTTTAAAQPAPEATAIAAEPPPPEEAESKHPHGKEPSGKAVGRQPK